ncbi:hypothetical protein GN244_ATG16592 [Phytophthora infestans]|uniref:Uncharacterized protein n=1 Tax=Phytophthora infestans TaxID=4787 RepID=A0A833T0E6_PHYIN|nr:hypothetical protein GN244_ATG16592 [Phytophthora infestans]
MVRYGRVDRTLRDSAELDRIRIRDKKRKEWDDTLAALKKLPPYPIHDRGSNDRAAYHTETLMRIKLQKQAARLVAEGKTMVMRSTAATLLAEDPTKASDDSAPRSRKKSSSRNYNAALHEALEAIDQVDSEPSVSCSDSDYEDDKTKGESGESDAAEGGSEGLLAENDGDRGDGAASGTTQVESEGDGGDVLDANDDSSDDSSDTEDKPSSSPNVHQTFLRRNKTLVIHSSNQEFNAAFDAHQVQSFQQFSKRTSTSVKVRNKQILRAAKKTMAAGKRKRKDVRLVPKQWETYSETLVCTHGQPYEPRGKGSRKHNSVRDTKCTARVNARVTSSISGTWYVRVTTSENHNHNLNKRIWENYAENRIVKDPRLTNDVEELMLRES